MRIVNFIVIIVTLKYCGRGKEVVAQEEQGCKTKLVFI
jgi:hypothetical protein